MPRKAEVRRVWTCPKCGLVYNDNTDLKIQVSCNKMHLKWVPMKVTWERPPHKAPEVDVEPPESCTVVIPPQAQSPRIRIIPRRK